MGWAQKLCETYDRISRSAPSSGFKPVAPVGFTEKRADYLVTLDKRGELFGIHKFGQSIVVPTLSSAENKTSSVIAPYPFSDELRYMAGDLDSCWKTRVYSKFFNPYIEQLGAWCARDDAPEDLRIIYWYLKKCQLMSDLMAHGLKLMKKDVKKTLVFTVMSNDGGYLWERDDFKKSWLKYLRETQTREKQLCYIQGDMLVIQDKHTKLFSNAKLISADDTNNIFKFKGRFIDAEQALSVSFDASSKINNTLKWLKDRQGFSRFGIHVIMWSPGGAPVKSAFDDNFFLDDEDDPPDTMEAYGKMLAKSLAGYRQRLIYDDNIDFSQVVVLGLEAATLGRMSIIHYQEMSISQYIENLQNWYSHCVWRLERTQDDKTTRFISSPTPREIATLLYGEASVLAAYRDARADKAITRQIRGMYMRLLQCIAEKRPLPVDIVKSAFHKVSNPLRYTLRNGGWDKRQWMRSLAIFCALNAKYAYDTKKEVRQVALDLEKTERNYLYGRLLAVANQVETLAMIDNSAADKSARQTNAIRYMQAMQLRPVETWRRINNLMIPYLGKLKAPWVFTNTLNEIGEKIDFSDNSPLDGRFLEGYYAQGYAYQLAAKQKKEREGAITNDGTEEQN
ncbi:MAG: type I-C CRISPR-associated protein Cas8c/Csd1 [Clostridia bacterium]|nr:type I-C CRISPR-associated protein Cas8c/Csd1 [Clostridia bacterium]